MLGPRTASESPTPSRPFLYLPSILSVGRLPITTTTTCGTRSSLSTADTKEKISLDVHHRLIAISIAVRNRKRAIGGFMSQFYSQSHQLRRSVHVVLLGALVAG